MAEASPGRLAGHQGMQETITLHRELTLGSDGWAADLDESTLGPTDRPSELLQD
jgi:hypothetical protein